MYLELVTRNQYIVEEFLKDFNRAYGEYFEGKPYLIKKGDYWSVVVGFVKRYFPHHFLKTNGQILLTVKLDIDMLIEEEMKKIKKTTLTDNEGGYLVGRYLVQQGKENKDVLKKVSLLVVQFVNDISKICNDEEVIFLGSALKALDIHKKVCQVCGKEFYGSGKALYCSNACKQKAKRQKQKQKKQK